MVRRKPSQVVRRIKQCAQDGLLFFSDHARREMNEEHFEDLDVYEVVLHGACVARLTHGGRGTRYVFRGVIRHGGAVQAVCRIIGDGVRVVTAYRV